MSSLQILRLASRTQPRSYLQSQFFPRRLPVRLRAPLAAYSSSSTADRDPPKEKQAEKEEHVPAPTKGAHDSETFEEFTDRSGETLTLLLSHECGIFPISAFPTGFKIAQLTDKNFLIVTDMRKNLMASAMFSSSR